MDGIKDIEKKQNPLHTPNNPAITFTAKDAAVAAELASIGKDIVSDCDKVDQYQKDTLKIACTVGKSVVRAKTLLAANPSLGTWGVWFERNCPGLPQTTASKYERIYKFVKANSKKSYKSIKDVMSAIHAVKPPRKRHKAPVKIVTTHPDPPLVVKITPEIPTPSVFPAVKSVPVPPVQSVMVDRRQKPPVPSTEVETPTWNPPNTDLYRDYTYGQFMDALDALESVKNMIDIADWRDIDLDEAIGRIDAASLILKGARNTIIKANKHQLD